MASSGLLNAQQQHTSILNQKATLLTQKQTPQVREHYARLDAQSKELEQDIAMFRKIDAGLEESRKRKLEQKVDALPHYIAGFESRDLTTSNGALIPQAFADIVTEAKKTYAPLLDYVTYKQSNLPEKFSFVDDTSESAAIMTEATSVTATAADPTLGSVTPAALDLLRVGGIKVSKQLVQDSGFDVAAFLRNVLLKRYFRAVSRILLTGKDAAGTTAPNNVSLLSIAGASANLQTTSAVASGIGWDDIVNTADSVDYGYIQNAVWIMSNKIRNYLLGQKDGFGRPFYTLDPANSDSGLATLLSRPVLIDPAMPDFTGAQASVIPILFADLRSAIGVQTSQESPSILAFKETRAEILENLYMVVNRLASVSLIPAAVSGLRTAAS
jgi:HK97 family phage major capsid protein